MGCPSWPLRAGRHGSCRPRIGLGHAGPSARGARRWTSGVLSFSYCTRFCGRPSLASFRRRAHRAPLPAPRPGRRRAPGDASPGRGGVFPHRRRFGARVRYPGRVHDPSGARKGAQRMDQPKERDIRKHRPYGTAGHRRSAGGGHRPRDCPRYSGSYPASHQSKPLDRVAVLALGTVAGASGASDWGGLLHMRDLFMFAYSRDQEAEADRVGMGYARAAGYEAEGLIEALSSWTGSGASCRPIRRGKSCTAPTRRFRNACRICALRSPANGCCRGRCAR